MSFPREKLRVIEGTYITFTTSFRLYSRYLIILVLVSLGTNE